MISLTGLEGFLPGPNITAENFIIQRRPRSHTLKRCVHLIIFQSVSLVKFITFHGNKYLSKYQIRLTLEDSNILSLNDFASFFFSPWKENWRASPSLFLTSGCSSGGCARLFATPWTVACTKLLHPWDFLGKSTGVGCRFLL